MILFLVSCRSGAGHADDLLIRDKINADAANQRFLEIANDMDLTFLKQKASEFTFREKSNYWLAVAEKIHESNREIMEFLDSLKVRLNRDSDAGKGNGFLSRDGRPALLHQWLVHFKQELQHTDTSMMAVMREKAFGYLSIADSIFSSGVLIQRILSGSDKNTQMFFLDQLRNDCLLTEKTLLKYCTAKIPIGDDNFSIYKAIIAQNMSVFSPGETLIITAGKGAFSGDPYLKVKAGDQLVKIDESGIAEFRIKVPSSPGKHILPVEMTFTDQDGKLQTILKEVAYSVVVKN